MRLVQNYRNKSGPGRNGLIKRLVLLTGVRHEACVQQRNKSGPTRNGLMRRLVLSTVVSSSGGYCNQTFSRKETCYFEQKYLVTWDDLPLETVRQFFEYFQTRSPTIRPEADKTDISLKQIARNSKVNSFSQDSFAF